LDKKSRDKRRYIDLGNERNSDDYTDKGRELWQSDKLNNWILRSNKKTKNQQQTKLDG